MENPRIDLNLIVNLVDDDSKVLDIGCGNGDLLNLLLNNKNIKGQGLEINQKKVNECVAKGLSVIQGDADKDLSLYPNNSFDCVVLSQTIQATQEPKRILSELTRIGKKVIVSIPNFGFWKVRLDLLFKGKMPITSKLDSSWYKTQNIHLCTITDFISLCNELHINIKQTVTLHSEKHKSFPGKPSSIENLLSEEAIFLLEG
ncbi:MAG: methionine biosynthesis protein MetW [Pseudomonadota bacterium]|nr:methionine biosynthesis protein MetW [Pseudomonadota bacterium]